jgi:hypothetical protein
MGLSSLSLAHQRGTEPAAQRHVEYLTELAPREPAAAHLEQHSCCTAPSTGAAANLEDETMMVL